MQTRHIVAIGGGGFLIDPGNFLLEPIDCLAFLTGSCTAHDNSTALHFVDNHLTAVGYVPTSGANVTSRGSRDRASVVGDLSGPVTVCTVG